MLLQQCAFEERDWKYLSWFGVLKCDRNAFGPYVNAQSLGRIQFCCKSAIWYSDRQGVSQYDELDNQRFPSLQASSNYELLDIGNGTTSV